MNANDAASIAEIASAALADLFDEELRAMGAADIAALEDRLLDVGHKAMARAFSSALQRYDLWLCASLLEEAGIHDRRERTRRPRWAT